MDQIQAVPASLPHIVQVYSPSVSIHPSLHSQGKVSYQQTITSESLHIPVSSQIHDIHNQHLISQNQTVMSCQHIHLQNVQPLQTQMQSQVLQGADTSHQLQITSHVILPQVPMFKQHLITNNLQHQYYGNYETFLKEALGMPAKVEHEVQVVTEKQIECKSENSNQVDMEMECRNRCPRNKTANPSKWACNIRKVKHQRGEAYINRRGKYVPEKCIRNIKDCSKSCRYKCNEHVSNNDRQHIFNAYYSLNPNEKKHFLLNTTERNYVKKNKSIDSHHKRNFVFKYFFLIRAVRHTVCKNFYLGTLAISQRPIYNVHMHKSEINLPKPDGRGLSETSTHSIPQEIKDRVRKHVMSFNTTDSKPIKQYSRKKQYLESDLSIKQMYNMYVTECDKDNIVPVKESMYRKIFKQEFNIHFKKEKAGQQLCCRCKALIKKK